MSTSPSAFSQNRTTTSPGDDGAYTHIDSLLRLRFAAQDLSLASPRPSQASLSGGSRTRFRGRGMEFEEVRVYQAGDDIRSIDWRVTARTQVPHTKLFREERERPTFIAADQRANLFFGSQRCFKSVLCARLASTIAWASLANSDRVGGLVFGNRDHKDIRPRRSKHAVLELIHHLNDFNHALESPLIGQRQVSLHDMLENTRRLAKPGSVVFFISDFQDFNPACEEQLYLLSRHTDITLFHVFDPLEEYLPNRGLLTVSNGKRRMQLAASDKKLRSRYHEQFLHHSAQILQCCQRYKIALHSFCTAEDELETMRQLYSKHSAKHRNGKMSRKVVAQSKSQLMQ